MMKITIVSILPAVLFIVLSLSCKNNHNQCTYQFSVVNNQNGESYIIHEMDRIVYESSSLQNEYRGTVLDSIFNDYSKSKVFIVCSWLDSYCILGMYYRSSADCNISYMELGELTEMMLWVESNVVSEYDMSNEKIFYLSKTSDRHVSISTNVIVGEDADVEVIPGISSELILDLKTMDFQK